MTAKKCIKNGDARAKFLLAYLISVLLFSLMSPSSLLKLNRDLRERFRLTRQQLYTCIMLFAVTARPRRESA